MESLLLDLIETDLSRRKKKCKSVKKTKSNNDEFEKNPSLSEYTITLLGYKKVKKNGSRHTNWYPWSRFFDVFQTIGYKTEWVDLSHLSRKNEKRLFITWNEPTSLDLYKSGRIKSKDIIFQKLTSLGKNMEKENWTSNPKDWFKEWKWPLYKIVEDLKNQGLNIYGFGCKTDYHSFPEKKKICENLKDRIYWISWGGTPFTWDEIKKATPKMDNFTNDIIFLGSKWGKIGRGNIDSWDKYITPLEKNTSYKFNQYGGIGKKMISNQSMVHMIQKSKLCPIIHTPSWQVERGVQDRFYTVFLSGRFGICDNLGIIDLFGQEFEEICTEDQEEYYKKSIYFLENPEKQKKYIDLVLEKIKTKFNFYRQWESILNHIQP